MSAHLANDSLLAAVDAGAAKLASTGPEPTPSPHPALASRRGEGGDIFAAPIFC